MVFRNSSFLVHSLSILFEAVHRTEANHAATWFGRFALSFGPLAGIMVYQTMNFASVLLLSCICLAVSFIFVNLIRFPFVCQVRISLVFLAIVFY